MNETTAAIKRAVQRGYWAAADGTVYGPQGCPLKLQLRGRAGKLYPCFNVLSNGVRRPIPAHKLIAYLKFGDASAVDGIVVRHLDDNPLNNSWENIAIGTQSDNLLDRAEIDRKLSAQKAGRTNSKPEAFWDQVRAEYESGASYNELTKKYGLAKGTLSYRLSKTGKRVVMQ
jgi:hypothetical protein